MKKTIAITAVVMACFAGSAFAGSCCGSKDAAKAEKTGSCCKPSGKDASTSGTATCKDKK